MSRCVTAVIRTFDARFALQRCLTAIAAQTRPVDAVIVGDNASTEPVRTLCVT
jgi:GT2 family glycosyltransferase